MTSHVDSQLAYRESVVPRDRGDVREIVESSGFFHDFEVDVAIELIDDALAKGERSEYLFVFAERDGRTVGYSCYGEIACTRGSYDLYWIAVREEHRASGIGGRLLAFTEERIAARGGRAIWVETSSKPKYEPTLRFYARAGYEIAAVLKDFYAVGDDKVVFVKRLG
ncbi:MAG: GNAT family N-acetyltransferase [Deltaproteobacteria bacterium]|nr:GNAT family N-acetyltransferase [Deltaproteobacteria bacterium]